MPGHMPPTTAKTPDEVIKKFEADPKSLNYEESRMFRSLSNSQRAAAMKIANANQNRQ